MIVSESPMSLPCSQALEPYRRVCYDVTYGLRYAGPEETDLGTLRNRHIVSGLGAQETAPVVDAKHPGTVKMVAAGAFSGFDVLYGAEDGKVDDAANGNPIGIAMEAATANGDFIEVLRVPGLQPAGADEVGGLEFFDDFIGDWPAAATACTDSVWTKTETLGLGVISSDQANGVLKFSFDAVAEVAVAALYMANSPFPVAGNPIFECRLAVYDKGDDAALDVNFGLANDSHATDCDAITESVLFHLDGNDLSLKCESDDGTTEVAATDTTVDLVDDTFYDFKIDCSDLEDVTFWYRAVGAQAWTRLLAATTFDISHAVGPLTPLFHVEKTSNDTTADVRADWVRVRSARG
jgi:hypothetical protein